MDRLWDVLNKIAIILGVVPFFLTHLSGSTGPTLIFSVYICALNVSLIGYVSYIHSRKKYRYAHIIKYIHIFNHSIRDEISNLSAKKHAGKIAAADYDEVYEVKLRHLLDQVANAFSHLASVRCSVCVKQLLPGRKLQVLIRDSQSHRRPVKSSPHSLDDDTPCLRIYEPLEPDESYYFCNDVIKAWRQEKFKSPSFPVSSEKKPRFWEFLMFYSIRYWPLRYKSCLVLPIRYVQPQRLAGDVLAKNQDRTRENYWGFLCIDAEHRGVLTNESWEVAAAFADALYLYSSTVSDILRREQK